MDVSLLSAGEDLSTYIMLNENSNSIVLDRPEYSNIENGIGILSSRSVDIVEGIKIIIVMMVLSIRLQNISICLL